MMTMRMTIRHISMARMVGMVLPFYLFTFLPLSAQTFTQQLQRTGQGGGVVTLHQDKAIDNLVNGPKPVVTVVTQKNEKTTTVSRPQQKDTGTHKETVKTQKEEKRTVAEHKTDSAQDSNPVVGQMPDTATVKKPVHTYKTMGFRVQAFAGGNSRKDKHKAEEISTQLRMLFPTEQVYMHFYSPRWICRIGNYRTYEEAQKMLEEVRGLGYTSATIVKGKISVPY